jgi:hypothetical protein
MLGIKSRKKVILAFAVAAMMAAVATSMVAYPAFAATEPEIQSKHIAVKAKGWAFQRVDSETIKQHNVMLELTLELGGRKGQIVAIASASGSVDVNGTIYTIQSGKGLIITGRHVVVARFIGVDAQGHEISLWIQTVYFWWGGELFAFRAKAVLRTTENPMLLLLRGAAKVQ